MYRLLAAKRFVFVVCGFVFLSTHVAAAQTIPIINTVAGTQTPSSGDNGPAVLAGLSFPAGIAVDGSGNFFVADWGFRVRKVTAQGIVTTVAGNGTFGFSGDGGPATSAEITGRGIAVDAAGNVFIADTDNHRIRKVTPAGVISTVAGTGTPGFSGDGGSGLAAQLNYPLGVAVDAAGDIWIADTSNQRIRKLTASGIISTVAGNGTSGFGGDGGAASSAELASPTGIALDSSGNILIADYGNNRIRMVNAAGVITTVAGNGVSGKLGDGGLAINAELNQPAGVAADSAGNVFIADSGNQRVREVNSAGMIQNIAGTGTAGFGGDGGPATAALLSSPQAVAVDAAGALLIADSNNNRVRKVRAIPAGTPAITSITPTSGARGSTFMAKITGVNLSGATAISFSGTGISATISSVDSSAGLTISITIAPTAAIAIHTFAVTTASGQSDYAAGFGVGLPPDDRVIGTAAGTGIPGFSGDGLAATSAQLSSPNGIAVDSAGNLFIADTNNHRIREVSATGVISTVAGTGTPGFSGDGGAATAATLSGPSDVAVDAAGNLYIADTGNYRVRKVTTSGTIVTVAGNGSFASAGDRGPATAAALCVSGVAVDSYGNLFIGDGCNERVRMVNTDGIISTFAGTGTQGFKGDGGPAEFARLSGPTRLAVDRAGDLFIVDSLNNRVREVNSEGIIQTVAPVAAWAIALDAAGNLIIVGDYSVLLVDSTGAIFTIAGGGTGTGDGNPATFVSLQAPHGVAVDAAGTIYVADASDNRVRTVSPPGAGAAAPLLASISTSSGTQGATVQATLNGFNLTGVNTVVFSGSGITAVINGVGTSTQIPVQISIAPAAATGTRTVTVATGTRISNSLTGFTVNVLPVIPPTIGSNVDGSPEISVLTAAQGTTTPVMIFGTGFTGASAVIFDGSGVTATILSGGTDSMIPVSITVAATASLGGRNITVTAAGGTSVARSGFTVIAPPSGNIITTIAGGGCCGYGGTGRPAINTPLSSPEGIALDAAGNIFFAESGNNLVRRINPFGVMDTIPGVSGSLTDVAADTNGNLYVADIGGQRVLKVSASGVITTVAGGLSATGGDGGLATDALLLSPGSVAVDTNGNLFIGDWNRVRMVNSVGVITTVAGNGMTGFAGDGGPATSAELSTALGIAFDAANNLYIADRANNRIRVVNSDGTINTVAGSGTAGSSGDGGPAILAQLNTPINVVVDKNGNIYTIDLSNRVRVINAGGTISTFAGNGTSGFSGDGGPATAAELSFGASGITADRSGNLYIADTGNNRIRRVTTTPAPVPSLQSIAPSSGTQGTTVNATITGSNLMGAAALIFSGTGVTAAISGGGNESSIPVVISIDPTAATGTRTVTLVTANGISAAFNGFTVTATSVPYISSIAPLSAVQGQTVSATVTGANLSGATALTFEGTGVTATVASGSDTSFPATVTIAPAASTGLHGATVTTPNGTSNRFSGFTINPSTPALSTLSVSSGTQGTLIPATITGTNLSGVTSVAFNGPGVFAAISGTPTPTSLTITISISASAPPGLHTLYVATADVVSAPYIGFSVLPASAPTITAISPGEVIPGTTLPVTITGINLANATTVAFSGTGVTGVITGTPTGTRVQVSVTAAAGTSPGTRTVTLTSSAGTSSPFSGFNVQQANSINVKSISPSSVAQGSAFTAIVSGTNLNGASGVLFSGSGVTAIVSAVNSATGIVIRGTVDASAATGLRTMTVMAPAGNSDAFSGLLITSAPRPSVITTVMGTGLPGYGGDGYNAAELFGPSGVAADGAGNIFIADTGNNRVRKLTPDLQISTVAGTGVAGASGDGGAATSATLKSPAGVALDSSGNLFIADTGNNLIRKVTPAGVISTVAANAGLKSPNAVAVDANGNLYIADTNNNRILKVSTDGSIAAVAGTGGVGFNGDGIPALAAELYLPAGVAVDRNGNLFIADLGNNRVRKVTTAGTITTIAGNGVGGFGGDGGPAVSAELKSPIDVKVDANGNVFVADFSNDVVRRINFNGIISTIAGNGTIGFSGDSGLSSAAQMDGPAGVGVDAAGELLIADFGNNRVRKVTLGGTITTMAGNGTPGFDGDGTAGVFAQMQFAPGLAVDAAGNLLVADANNARIRKLTRGGLVTSVAGNGTPGFAGDGGPASAAELIDPEAVAADGQGNVFIADTGNSRIREVTTGGVITTVAGNGMGGTAGDGGQASIAEMNPAFSVAVDASGNLYAADANNNRIRIIKPGGLITTFAGTGMAGFTGDGGPAIAATLNNPTGVAVDNSGNLFIADNRNNRIRMVNASGVISTLAGTGAADYDGDDGPATLAPLNMPRTVAVDAAGNVFVADNSGRVRMVNPLGIITTVAGNGVPGFSGDGGQATAAQISPSSIAVDGSGNLFIGEINRVRKVIFTADPSVPAITGISPFSGAQGTTISATISGSSLSNATAVSFSGTGITAAINSGGTDQSLPVTITIAANAAGLRTLQVTTPAGMSEVFSGFTVTNAVLLPVITGITPNKGVIGTSLPAVISGTSLTSASTVSFIGTGVSATIDAGGNDQALAVTITIGEDAPLGVQTLTVTTPAGTSAAFNGFTVSRPTITGISTPTGTQGFSIPALITGSTLSGATSVSFSGTGVSATIQPGATDTSVPVLITIAASAPAGLRAITVTTTNSTTIPFNGFTVAPLGPSGVIFTFAGDGTTDFKGDGGQATAASLYGPNGVSVDAAGNVYIADTNHNRIRKVNPNGVISTVAGNDGQHFGGGDGGAATAATLFDPTSAAPDHAGNLFISDYDDYRIRVVAPNGIINTFAGNGAFGFSGDGGQATLAELNFAISVTTDASGNVYIADRENHRIRKVTPGGIITTVAGNGTAAFSGDGGQATAASLCSPSDVAVDAAGNIFIADSGNMRIRKVTPGGIITTVAGSANGSGGDGVPATETQFEYPDNVAVDQAGNIYIADSGTRKVRKVDSTGTISTIAGGGDIETLGDGGPAINSSLQPAGLAVDSSGNLLIADFSHNRIRKIFFTAPSPPVVKRRGGQVTSQ